MRRIMVAVMAIATLGALAAVAFAQNSYEVTGRVSPSNAGSTRSPVPVSLTFNYNVTEAQGRRPFTTSRFDIGTPGLRVNTNRFPSCTAAQINQAGSDENCPNGSLVGAGLVENITGSPTNQNDQSLRCNLRLRVHNTRNNRAALFLSGNPQSSDPASRCAIAIATAIPAQWVRSTSALRLVFSVPESLRRPGGLQNAVVRVQSSIRLRTVRYRGRRVGYLESVGGCRGNRRNITVRFTDESGRTTPASSAPFACRR